MNKKNARAGNWLGERSFIGASSEFKQQQSGSRARLHKDARVTHHRLHTSIYGVHINVYEFILVHVRSTLPVVRVCTSNQYIVHSTKIIWNHVASTKGQLIQSTSTQHAARTELNE